MERRQTGSANEGTNKKSIKKNYLFNLSYQIFSFIVPLLVTPYVSRVLTSEGVGQYSFAFSLISYFTIFGTLGFGYYAQREIAKYQNDKHKQSVVFWEINICRSVPVLISLLINVFCCYFSMYGNYNLLMWIFNINIIALMLDISFFFQGNEEFGKLFARNLVVKVLSVAAIFIFIKKPDDLWLYALINSASVFFSAFLMWVVMKKYLAKVRFSEIHPFRHLKGTLILFLPTIAVSIYTILDKTLIGVLVSGETIEILEDGTEKVIRNSDLQNGFYEQSEKIVKMALTVLTSLGAVMVPKNSYYFGTGQIDEVKKNIYKALEFVIFIGTPIMFGLMAVASNFSPWFFGKGYDEVPAVIMVLSPLILAIGFNNVFGLHYLVPAGKDWVYTTSVIIGAFVNLVLNILFIPLWGAIGAAIASVIAETSILFFQMFYLRKDFLYRKVVLSFLKHLCFSCIMFVLIYFLSVNVFKPSIINTFILIAIGAAVYLFLLLVTKDKMLFSVANALRKRISKKKVKII